MQAAFAKATQENSESTAENITVSRQFLDDFYDHLKQTLPGDVASSVYADFESKHFNSSIKADDIDIIARTIRD